MSFVLKGSQSLLSFLFKSYNSVLMTFKSWLINYAKPLFLINNTMLQI